MNTRTFVCGNLISRISPKIFTCIFTAFLAVIPVRAWGEGYQIVRIADSISNPELGFLHTSFATPVIEGDYVVFRTLNNVNKVANIWSWNVKTRQFTKLVDLSMAAPGGTGNFTDLNAGMGGPILRDGIVVFGAQDSGSPSFPALAVGIYSVPVTGGAIQRVANYNSDVPGGIGKFFNFSALSTHTGVFSFSDGVVGLEGEFGGEPIGNSGIYQSDISGSSQAPIADSLHGIGDLFPITNFTHVDVNQNRAAFIGGNVFTYSTLFSTSLPASLGNYNQLLTIDTVMPGATGGFTFVIPSVRLFGDKVFFIARDSVPGGSNNRRTLYQIPFAGGSPEKILSNFDSLEGLSSIEYSSISSYDVNQQHLLIRAKAPGSTPEQGLYLFDRATQQFTNVFTLNQTILERNFGVLAEVQPGSISADSSRIVASIGGSAIFVGPFGYLVLITTDEALQEPVTRVKNTLDSISSQFSEAKKKLPAKPGKSVPKNKRDKINAKRAAIKAARSAINEHLKLLKNLEKESGDQIRTDFQNLKAKNLSKLNAFKKTATSSTTSDKDAKQAWNKFKKLLETMQQES